MESSSSAGGGPSSSSSRPSRYESQKRRDWNTFLQYLRNHKPPLVLSQCSAAHLIEFLRHLDQYGKTKVHLPRCPFYGAAADPTLGIADPTSACGCPLRQAWGSLDALVGRLRAAYEESGSGTAETNPFAARAVRIYLRDVRDAQAKARGIPFHKKRRSKGPSSTDPAAGGESVSSSNAISGDSSGGSARG
ncbi:protein LIGHT-DEPENDENT SHORT HYPOCOTYLS 5-like [Zingiber officinale]|uniref:ALOG domain-containing protein n=1 Tax=Zingiber officinale TaxID=94328 RepID=A0A8J5GT76_ZINOF|nr:protein LIGHT-DEPENDENT SHORT HYPOCOTYLS 5-like [Zingiber officinale]KAG6513535.1 hypothetical protein ZIOFF_023867 [Zingiber officinale]